MESTPQNGPSMPTDHPRDEKLLRFTGRYQIGLYAAYSKLFFGGPGKPVGHIAKKLSEPPNELLKLHGRKLTGGITYAQLTTKACHELGLPAARAKELGAAALDQAIGTLFFCALESDSVRRYRLETSELSAILGKATPPSNVMHVLSDEQRPGRPAVYRVYQGAASARDSLGHIRRQIEKAECVPALSAWIRDGDYGFALLGPTGEAVASLRRAAERMDFEAAVLIGLGPTSETLSRALKARKRRP